MYDVCNIFGYYIKLPKDAQILIQSLSIYPRGWTMPRGRPQASCLRQVESFLTDRGMAGLASAWAMARRRPREYKVNAATRCSGGCPHT